MITTIMNLLPMMKDVQMYHPRHFESCYQTDTDISNLYKPQMILVSIL